MQASEILNYAHLIYDQTLALRHSTIKPRSVSGRNRERITVHVFVSGCVASRLTECFQHTFVSVWSPFLNPRRFQNILSLLSPAVSLRSHWGWHWVSPNHLEGTSVWAENVITAGWSIQKRFNKTASWRNSWCNKNTNSNFLFMTLAKTFSTWAKYIILIFILNYFRSPSYLFGFLYMQIPNS